MCFLLCPLGFSYVEAFLVPNILALVRIGTVNYTVWMILAKTTKDHGKYKKTTERGKAFAVNSVPQGVPQRHRYLVCLFVLVVRSHLTVTAGMCPHRKLPKEIPQSLPLGVAWYIWLGNSSNPYRSIWTMRSHLKSQKSNKLGVAVEKVFQLEIVERACVVLLRA